MTVMSDCRGAFIETPRLMSSPNSRAVLNRQVLSAGAAWRRAQAQEIETKMDMACERAAIGPTPYGATRDSWNKRAWNRYVAEAVNQSRAHSAELQALWRDAIHLERLADAL